MDRRHFLSMLGLGAVGLALPGVAQADILKQAAANPNIKPISGSWFEFQHPGGKEGVYWDKDLRQFTAAQWREKIREIRDRKSTRLNSSHIEESRMPSSA